MPTSQFAACLSTHSNTEAALGEVTAAVRRQLGGPADVAFVFASSQHAFEQIPAAVCQELGTQCVLGVTGESIVGTAREIEGEPALSLWAARLPETRLWPMHLEFERTPDGGLISGWPSNLPDPWPENGALLLLGEPYSFPADLLLEQLNEDRPGFPVIGGMASGGSQPGEHRLCLGSTTHTTGAVGLLMAGGVRVQSLVSQGCRPIGRPYVVTKSERNIMLELGGKPALRQLQELFAELPTSEQKLVQQGLHVGRVVNEYQEKFETGDFLIRNVMGFDPKSGAIAIGDFVRPGQTVQFHVRDAATASDELKQLLLQSNPQPAFGGGLLFTCNGRGTRLFATPHHDAGLVQQVLGNMPLAGLFAAGEIGPVGGRNFLHGFTASLALFS